MDDASASSSAVSSAIKWGLARGSAFLASAQARAVDARDQLAVVHRTLHEALPRRLPRSALALPWPLDRKPKTTTNAGRARGWPMRILLVFALLGVLLGAVMPPLDAARAGLDEYHALRTLADDGLNHLLAAKGDAQAFTDTFSLSGVQGMLAPPASMPSLYSYLLQRQAGTDYPVAVNISPAPKMSSSGLHALRAQPTVASDTLVTYPVNPQATATPATTPATSAQSSSLSGSAPSGAPAAETGSTTTKVSATATIVTVAGELHAAETDFVQLQTRLSRPDWALQMASSVPGVKPKLAAALALAQTGCDITTIGLSLLEAVTPLVERVSKGALAAQGDLVTPADMTALQQAMAQAIQGAEGIQTRLAKVDIGALPLTAAQRALFTQQLQQLPKLTAEAKQALAWLPAVSWMLGVGQQRNFLVQTLDRTELRASGGFTGDYGVLSIGNGRVAPFTLNNINDIEYGYKTNGYIVGNKPPAQYSWWPFANFGLRDSNLSADFPTTARLNMQLFKNEGGGDVDGVIQVTPMVIEDVMRVTGPIYVPGYNETVTADNLEQRIEYYQQDPAGIAKEQQLNPNDHTHSLRKRFTQLVTQLLEEKVKQAPQSQMLPIARQVMLALKSKDLQIYVTNPQIEGLLTSMNAAGAAVAPAGTDTYLLVQANVSVAKSTPYVQVTQTDNVTLDDSGGATHNLTITFDNNPAGPIYGYPTYRDYVRVYAPANARFTGGTGFDEQRPMCYTPVPAPPAPAAPAPTPTPIATAPSAPETTATPAPSPTPAPPPGPPPPPPQYANLPPCPAAPYSSTVRSCPSSYYGYGGQASTVLAYGDSTVPALDRIGGPTNTTSDIAGLSMRGGYVIVPRFCTARITLKWYVPNVVRTLPAQTPGQK